MKQKELFLNKYKINFYFRKSVFWALNMKTKFTSNSKQNLATSTKKIKPKIKARKHLLHQSKQQYEQNIFFYQKLNQNLT